MEPTKKPNIFSKPWVQSVAGIGAILIIVIAVLVYKNTSARIYTDRALIEAPVIAIGPEAQGILDQVYVKSGDTVKTGDVLAHVGSETLTSRTNGIVISTTDTPGQVFSPSQSVIRMIDPNELRVVGTVKETEGLSSIKIGAPATFTVDAFGGATFNGVVDEISPTSKESGVAFSISDQREVKEFEIKIQYDVAAHPEFKNGMSAKLKIYKQ